MAKIYALSIKQPWATLLIAGLKTIEVRSWSTRIRGRILIHAAGIPDERPEGWKWITEALRPMSLCTKGIIGEAILHQCVSYRDETSFTRDSSLHLNDPTWFQERGLFGFVFRDAKSRPFMPFSGNVRFFTVEEPA